MDRGDTTRQQAGRKGGVATRDSHGTDHFRKIGTRGGNATMQKHADEYSEYRQRGGNSTYQRHGSEHYRDIARQSAQVRQEKSYWRDLSIHMLLDKDWKIPTIIQLTLDDIPQLLPVLGNTLQSYLELERPQTASPKLFVSRSGRPLGLANTYKKFGQKSCLTKQSNVL